MTDHKVEVTIIGPFAEMGDIPKQQLQTRLERVLSDRGFKRETQRIVSLQEQSTKFVLVVSLSHDTANRMDTGSAESLYGIMLKELQVAANIECELEQRFLIHTK